MSERCKHCGRTIVRWGGCGDLWVHKDDDHTFCPMDDDDNNYRAKPSPEPEPTPDDDQTAWASIEASRKIARGHAEIKQELTRVAEDQNLRPHFFNRIGKSNMCADCDFRWTDPIHLVGEPRMYQPPASEAQAPAVTDDDILKRLDRANRIVAGIHSGSVKVRMSIPAAPDRDADLVACAAIRDAKAEIASLRERLEKAEAGATPLSGWCSSCDRIDEPGNVECSTCGDTLIFSGEEADYLRNQLEGCAIVSRNYRDGVEYLKESGYGEQWKLVAICRQSLDACIAELAQLRARVAILDAQEVELPELPKPLRNSKFWDEGIEWGIAGERAARLEREAQLLESQRAVQAKNGVIRDLAGGIVEEYSPCVVDESFPRLEWCVTHQTKRCGQKALYEKAVAAIAAYGALAGKGE